MTTQVGKTGNDERGLLPYPVIIAATKGEPAGNEYCLPALRRLYRPPFYEKTP